MARPKKTEENTVLADTKAKRIEALKLRMEKDFGKGTLIGATDKPMIIASISTGSIGLDKALGIGGLPKGRIVEIYGPESSGKTTICQSVIAQAHALDSNSYCAFVDAEHALDLGYMQSMGVDLNRLEISQPDYGEQALEIARQLIKSGDFDVVVIDSVAALVPKSELEGEIGDVGVSKQARMMSQAMRILTADVEKSNTLVIFTNQIREKIGVMFGNPETTSGGNALKFFASVRMDIRKVTTNKDGEEAVSNKVRVKVIKNKVAPPFRQAEFNLVFGTGIDKFDELINLAVDNNVVKKSGSWFSYEENKIGQGIDSVMQLLADNPELFEEIKIKTLEVLNPTIDEKLLEQVVEVELTNELVNELILEDESENKEIISE
jgi:recombination protein RecA